MSKSLEIHTRRWLPILVLWIMFGLLLYNAEAQSPTMDEHNHITRGYALLRTGDARLSLEHPPLINLLEALPLLSLREKLQLPLDHWSWEQGYWYGFANVFFCLSKVLISILGNSVKVTKAADSLRLLMKFHQSLCHSGYHLRGYLVFGQ